MKPKKTKMTIRLANEIRDARLSGMSFLDIARQFNVCIATAQRHGDPDYKAKQDQRERDRYYRNKASRERAASLNTDAV